MHVDHNLDTLNSQTTESPFFFHVVIEVSISYDATYI